MVSVVSSTLYARDDKVYNFKCKVLAAGALARDVPRETLKPRAWELADWQKSFNMQVRSVYRSAGVVESCRHIAREYARSTFGMDLSDETEGRNRSSFKDDEFGYECLSHYEAQISNFFDSGNLEYRSYFKNGPFVISGDHFGSTIESFEFSVAHPNGFKWHLDYVGSFILVEGVCQPTS